MEDNLINRDRCYVCDRSFILERRNYAQLIKIDGSMKIVEIVQPRFPTFGPQRVCMSLGVPLDECIKVCVYPCWYENKDTELRKYAHAPFASQLKEFRVG